MHAHVDECSLLYSNEFQQSVSQLSKVINNKVSLCPFMNMDKAILYSLSLVIYLSMDCCESPQIISAVRLVRIKPIRPLFVPSLCFLTIQS